MGQFALGIRSLLIKSAVFVALAALLAWALGGTLFPRPEVARPLSANFDGQSWAWKLSVGGKIDGEVKWELVAAMPKQNERTILPDIQWAEPAGGALLLANQRLYAAGRALDGASTNWLIIEFHSAQEYSIHPMPDRFAVEQQMARLRAGHSLQDVQTIEAQRSVALDPSLKNADGSEHH